MASITCRGTCVPPGPSRKTAGCSLTVCESAGNCERTQVRSSAVDEEEAGSAMGIADILMEGGGMDAGAFVLRFSARMKPAAAVQLTQRVREDWVACPFLCWRRPAA